MPHAPILLVAVLTFLAAGCVKGIAGMGLPTVAMGMLGLVLHPAEAAALVFVPSLITNVWQFLAGRSRLDLLRRLWPMMLGTTVATIAAAGLLTQGDVRHATIALGAALIAYAAIGLTRLRLAVPRRYECWASPAIGSLTGLVTGATGVFVVPAAPYLATLGLDKDALVQALGLCFTTSTVALAAGLATHGALPHAAIGASALCTVPALAGMQAGQLIRSRVNPATFRLVFFLGLLLLGAELVAR